MCSSPNPPENDALTIPDDILKVEGNGKFPSAITAINGKPVVEFLTAFAAEHSRGMLEPHADWNNLMWHPSLDLVRGSTAFTGGAIWYPGDELSFTFENGSTLNTFWIAEYIYPYDTGPLTTGGDFYNYFVLGNPPASLPPDANINITIPPETDGADWSFETSNAYPNNPNAIQGIESEHDDSDITGYIVNYGGNLTGVLCLPTFQQTGEAVKNATNTIQEFIKEASEAGAKHVIIDLHGNTGGLTSLAYQVFARFFPSRATQAEPFGGSRRRSHFLADVLGHAMTEFARHPDNEPNEPGRSDEEYLAVYDSEWVIENRINAETGNNFRTWGEYSGPRRYHGDNFTLVERYNVTDPVFSAAGFHLEPFGFTNTEPEVDFWKPEDIVLLTDGMCSSACALLVEFMTRIGVRTVVAGGRPEAGPMQAVGGSRGARDYAAIELDVDFVLAGLLNKTANVTLPEIPSDQLSRDTGMWISYAGLNLRDQIRKSDLPSPDPIPLQFRYEAADCRIYYRLDTLWNMTQLWQDAADASWGGKARCVPGSTNHSTTAGQGSNPLPPPTPLHASSNTTSPTLPDDKRINRPANGTTLFPTDNSITSGPTLAIKAVRLASPNCAGDPCADLECRSVTLKCPKSSTTSDTVTRDLCVPKARSADECARVVPQADALDIQPVQLARQEVKIAKEARAGDSFQARKKKDTFVCVPKVGTAELCR